MHSTDSPALERSSTYRRLKRSLKAFAHQFPEDGRRVIQCVEEALLKCCLIQVRPSGERVNGRCTSENELQLLESDKEEHAHRSVGRLLWAGTDYRFVDGTFRPACVESYKMLLGPFFPESGLPSFGGRQFIAGVLASMLHRRNALTDIHKWFYKPTNQDLEVHEELSDMLSQHGLSWPPMLESMSSCAAYNLSSRASASNEPIAKSFLMLMPDREWIGLALHFCHLEQDPTQRLAFFGCLEALQVFFWLTEATTDSKESRWKCIREKLQHKLSQSQHQMQQSQQQQQQEQGRTPVQGLGLQARLVQRPAGAGPIIPAPSHLGLQAAQLTDTEKTRFKAELSRSDLLRQGNQDLVKYLLLRAEDRLSWASIPWSQLQIDQILPDQPYTRSSGTLWQPAVLNSPSPTDPECARQHWTASQIQSARRSIGNMLLLQAATSFTDRQRKQEFSGKKKDYVFKFNSELFPMSAAILNEPFFSCKYEYADRQHACLMRLCQTYGL